MNQHGIAFAVLLAAAAAAAAVAGPALGQAKTFTSPKGLASTEASGVHGFLLGSATDLTWQQIDTTQRGVGYAGIKSISWRRDGASPANNAYAARTLQSLSVVMAHADLAVVTERPASNYKGTPTTVFPAKDVSVPSWVAAPAGSPASFTVTVPFASTWTYSGNDDLLWEVAVKSVQPAPSVLVNYPFDFQPLPAGAFRIAGSGSFLGQGCRTVGQGRSFVIHVGVFNQKSRFQLRHSANFAPPQSDIVSFVDAADRNQAVPGLCAVMHVNAWFPFPMGKASSGGSVASAYVDIPYVASAIGTRFFMQSAGLDATQGGIPLSLSQGVRMTVPVAPVLPQVGYLYSQVALGTRTYSGPWGGGVVAQFDHD